MFPLALFVAAKYLRFGKKDKSISFMIRICFLGIFIGTFALMLTLIITNGFEKVIHEKMQGITSQALIYAPGQRIDDASIKKVLASEFATQVKVASSSSIKQVIIDHHKQQSIMFLKGVEPRTEGLVSSIGDKIRLPVAASLEGLLTDKAILIGHKTAQQYNLSIGSSITILIPEPTSKKRIFLNKKKAVVAGIFNIGLEEYDSNFAYCSLAFFRSLFKEKEGDKSTGVDTIALKFHEKRESLWQNWFSKQTYEQRIISKLRSRLTGLTISSWQDQYPALVSSLKLEKYVMFFILALISLVACMNMISLLFMQIQQKRKNIAIFKAMGMAHKHIKRIFLIIGMAITLSASICGLGLAAVVGYFLERYPFIKLPDVYYVSHLPARMDLEIFLVVFACTLLLGFLATWIPARRTKKINVVDVLRKE